MKIKAILFDIDGTLLDSTEFIHQAAEYTFTKFGLEIPSREIRKTYVGGSLKKFYEDLIPNMGYELLHKTHGKFQMQNVHLAILFPKVLEILQKVKDLNYKIIAITSRHKDSLMHSLKHNKIDHFFDLIISADDVKNHKPHPESVLKALKKLKLKKTEVIFVGDSAFDIKAGKAAGVKTVGVTYGFGGEELISAKPDFIIDKLSSLLKLI